MCGVWVDVTSFYYSAFLGKFLGSCIHSMVKCKANWGVVLMSKMVELVRETVTSLAKGKGNND